MASKIEIYREVLEIEPNSKVFFPLARQLSQDGRNEDAVTVLKQGIAFHPDHLEAKFLLIELLSRQGREEEADGVFGDVGSLLARYPSVWLLWSKIAAVRSKDPSLAMLFLAHYFQNETLTWSEVVERGLQSLSQAGAVSRPVAEASPVAPAPATPPQPVATCADMGKDAAFESDFDDDEEGGDDGPPLRGATEVQELAGLLDAATETAETGKTTKGREPVVCTKTMAAVLAGQGDIEGALTIYKELLASAAPGPERDALLQSIRELSPDMAAPDLAPQEEPAPSAAPAAPAAGEASDAGADKPQGAAKLVSLLEALAGRLEARAGR